MLKAEPVQTAEEFFEELFCRWRRRTIVFRNFHDCEDGYIEKHTARMTVKNGTWYLYQHEGEDDASKIYEKGNE